MKRYLYVFVAIAFCASLSVAQNRINTGLYSKQVAKSLPSDNAAFISNGQPSSSVPFDPISSLVSIPGGYDLGLLTKWHLASNGGPLHNIQIDPSNPQKIHACIMAALNTTPAQTTTDSFYPNRRVFYFYSGDGGQTWTAPKPLSSLRTGYPSMILIKRNEDYIPVIAAHRNFAEVGTDIATALYIETGAPGAGVFKEVITSRETYSGIASDILWPAIAVSKDGTKILTIASVSAPTNSLLTYMQFGVFTLNSEKTDATWSGWIAGPGPDEQSSITTGGFYAIRVAASGKVGVVWKNYDVNTPDLGLYISETTDNGATWSSPENFYYTLESGLSDQTGNSVFIIPNDGLDFFYDGEVPSVVFSTYYATQQGTYYPATGGLLYWKKGMAEARILLLGSLGDQNELHQPEFESSFLSPWTSAGYLNFQGNTNLSHPVLSLSSDPSKYSIYFTAIENGDTGVVAQFVEASLPAGATDSTYDTTESMAYSSIWKMTTQNGGATFTAPVKILGNAEETPQELRIDYRFPQTSFFTPSGGGQSLEHVMFAVDTCPGTGVNGAKAGFNDAQWVLKQFPTNAVKSYSYVNGLSLGQNYPNPSVSGATVVPFELSNVGEVVLTVTDLIGREVLTISKGRMEAGKHSLPIDISSLTNGVYQYTLRSSGETLSRLMTVVKD